MNAYIYRGKLLKNEGKMGNIYSTCLKMRSNQINPDRVDLSHFTVERELGKGGFGTVKAIRRRYMKRSDKVNPNKDDKEWYAIKQMKKKYILETDSIAMVKREMEILIHIGDHPMLCNLHYVFQDDFYLYFVLDIYLGGDLRFHLNNSKPFKTIKNL